MIYSFLVGELSGHYIVRPHLTLAHDSLDSIIHTLWRIFVFFSNLLTRRRIPALALSFFASLLSGFAKQICQFFRDSNKLVMLVKVLDCLRLCEGIIESKLVRCQSEFSPSAAAAAMSFASLSNS